MQELIQFNYYNKPSISLNLVGAFIIIEFAFLLSGLLFNIPAVIMILLILASIIIFTLLEPKFLFYSSILAIIFTEFYWFEILGGYLKPFHILSILVFFFFSIFYLKILKHSKIIWLIIFFIIINIFVIVFSSNQVDALRSFVLPLILITIAVNMGVMLGMKKLTLAAVKDIVLYGTLIAIGFGFLQMIVYSISGGLLVLTEGQISQILIAKRPPSFFTEADTFGKFLSLPFFLFLPFTLEKKKQSIIVTVIILAAILINMTRSAMIGIGITLIMYLIYSLKRKSLTRNMTMLSGVVALMLILIPFIIGTTSALGSQDELSYRFQTLISPTKLMADGSTHFRFTALEETVKGIFENSRTILSGHGWGQSYINVWGIPYDVCGSLFINIIYYSGIFALLIFLWFCYHVLKILYITSKMKNTGSIHLFAEGLFFGFLCMLIISQLASMWIAPEFWLVIGCAIYLELWYNRKNKAGRYVR